MSQVWLGMPEWLKTRRQEKGTNTGLHVEAYEPSRASDDNAETSLLKDVAFNRHSMNDGHHVSPSDNGKIQVGTDGITVRLVQGIDEESFKRTLSMATRATIGIDLTEEGKVKWEPCPNVREARDLEWTANTKVCEVHPYHRWNYSTLSWDGQVETGQDWKEMLKGGLQTALETQVIVFAVSGLSRTCTHQLVRSRRASFHQQSQRASYYGDMPELRMPESVWRNPNARKAFLYAAEAAAYAYRVAADQDIAYQDARYILPEATTNYIMLEYPVREFLNVYAYRGCSMFSWEIVSVMRECRRLLVEAHPWLAPYIKISCQDRKCDACGGVGERSLPGVKLRCVTCMGTGMIGSKCTFQGWENVEGQCDFPQAKEELRTFRSDSHRIERKAKA